MSKEQTQDLLKFLSPFSEDIQALALWLRAFVWELYPDSNELIYDNYNAVAIGWSPTDKVGHTFCSIAIGSNKYVHFGFYWGAKLTDPAKILLGKGSQYRYIKVKTINDFPAAYMEQLMEQAYRHSLVLLAGNEPPLRGMTIVKSISAVQKRPGSPLGKKN